VGKCTRDTGGDVEKQVASPAVIAWLQLQSKDAEVVMSVCNGAFILAKAGLLDGLEATTTAGLIPLFRQVATKTKVVDDRRFVDNGKIIRRRDSRLASMGRCT
jgi:transcriptional regulator GlxA family with amidase domain